MIQIAPSILSADFSALGSEISRLEKAGADWVHIDVMDGHFVPNLTLGPPVIKALRKKTAMPFDVHLMIEAPDRSIQNYIDAGSDCLTVHQETCAHLHRTIQTIKNAGIKAGVSLNPATPVWTLENILDDVDLVLVMSVNPGFGGQTFIHSAVNKIRQLDHLKAERGLEYLIQVDGGINAVNARDVCEAGAEVLVAGSAVFGSPDLLAAIEGIRSSGEAGAAHRNRP